MFSIYQGNMFTDVTLTKGGDNPRPEGNKCGWLVAKPQHPFRPFVSDIIFTI